MVIWTSYPPMIQLSDGTVTPLGTWHPATMQWSIVAIVNAALLSLSSASEQSFRWYIASCRKAVVSVQQHLVPLWFAVDGQLHTPPVFRYAFNSVIVSKVVKIDLRISAKHYLATQNSKHLPKLQARLVFTMEERQAYQLNHHGISRIFTLPLGIVSIYHP